ncbi:hypothetical protein NLG97_g7668 [Lecanicillium saksenae]|uniref:Uncharacterized protein n=1 Tax=Lecanicillium saksenae TaxID=468837 RepID=A0ACC1QL74_9HYPO|nr:hypothetical protein NLG97_g7668 [Lecanicillium saksenae]
MDHIPLPSDDLARLPMEVPCLFGNGFAYDDQGMLTYPARAGVDTARLAADADPHLSLFRAAAFIQAWLWCGLLQEGLRVGFRETTATKHVPHDLFVKYIDGKPFLTMKPVFEVMSRACNSDRPPVADDWHRERVLSCIDTALGFVRDVFRDGGLGSELLIADDRDCLPEVTASLLSVQVLCVTLLDGLGGPVISGSKSSTLRPPLRQPTQIVDFLLQTSGWHTQDIIRLPQNIIFRYYLSFYHGRNAQALSSGGVGEASSFSIAASSIQGKENVLVPKHTHPSCRCDFITANSVEIEELLLAGKQVCVRFVQETGRIAIQPLNIGSTATTTMTETATELEANMPLFLAVSHVRSEGLGNEMGHSLPFCQLVRLQSLADSICTSLGNKVAYFWIDTLCLPQDRRKRKVAVQAAWQIFRAARAVVVVDPVLSRHLVSSSEEALLRIRYSSWKSRLWTLEEAFFARRLLFCFSNRTVCLDHLLQDFESRDRSIPVTAMRILQPLRAFLEAEDEERLPQLIVSLDHDVHLLMKIQASSSSSSSMVAANVPMEDGSANFNSEMKGMLRLAYLMAGKLRYLVEEDERRLLPRLWEELDKLYGPLVGGRGDNNSSSSSHEPQDGVAARERIKQLCEIFGRQSDSHS